MIEAILDFFLGTLVDIVFDAAHGLFGFFSGKRRGSKHGKDSEKADESGHE